MAELREVVASLGHTDVRTVLQSGNVVFTTERAVEPGAAVAVEQALLDATGVQASVLLVPAEDLAAIAAANPLRDIMTDASRGFVTFLSRPLEPGSVPAPDVDVLALEVLVVAEQAIYQWCPDGALATKVPPAWWRQLDRVVTTRNWRTVQRLVELCALSP